MLSVVLPIIYDNDSAYSEHMYEILLHIGIDLATFNNLPLQSTDNFGYSGSPVLVKDEMRAIGLHVYREKIDSASCIGPLGKISQHYKGYLLVKPGSTFDITSRVLSGVNLFRDVSIPSKYERESSSDDMDEATSMEFIT